MSTNRTKLRPPTKTEYQKGLPTSKADAIKIGITRFNPGDDKGERIIRNYGSEKFPKGVVATAGNRKATRGGGSGGSRRRNELLSTPKHANSKEFGKAMTTARSQGLVGDHRYSVARTGNALADMSKNRQALMHHRFEAAGIAIGNQAANIDAITEKLNYDKVTQERALDKAIQNAGKKLLIFGGDNDNGNADYKYSDKEIVIDSGKVNGKTNGSGLAIKTKVKDFKVGKVRLADQAVNMGINVGTGNYAGAALGGGAIAMSETLKSKAAQKAIAKQIATIAAKRGGKSALKLIPGVDILLSGKESYDYLSQGKLDQAGIAALSGAIGWIPIVGDGASAALDFTNTGIDLARLDVPNRMNNKNRTKLKRPKGRLKLST